MKSRPCAFAFLCSSLVALSIGCGESATPPAGADAGAIDAPVVCSGDLACDDGVFCNGAERCAPGEPGASALGCVSGMPPCTGAEVCDEAADACGCGLVMDADGDGERSIACGGSDCDDSDARRYPGASEVCDAAGIDEDCDPTTIGPDADGDGFVRAGCCNLQSDGSVLCGTDCDDANLNVAPGAPEICDGIDNDCENGLDYPGEDDDGDGWADCVDLPAEMRDCDDSRNTVHPGATERCDGLDSDCDGVVPAGEDEDADGFAAMDSTCEGGFPKTDCDDLTRARSPGHPREVCDALDTDCDGTVDEGCTTEAFCDPVTEAAAADPDVLGEIVEDCYATCGSDAACREDCVIRGFADRTSPLCSVCLEPFPVGLIPRGDCGPGSSCRSALCSSDEYEDCIGRAVEGCGTGITGCDDAFGRYPRCAEGTCTDAECVSACAAPTALGCRPCLMALQTCEATHCAVQCGDHHSYLCRSCLETHCIPAYNTCLEGGPGVMAPSCTSTEAGALESPSGTPADLCIDGCLESCSGSGCLLCGMSCISAAAGGTTISSPCQSCYHDPGYCRNDAEAGACATACATPGAACDACVCDACEADFYACSGFTSSRCRGL